MNEFEEHDSLIQIVSKKMAFVCNEELQGLSADMFDYLVQNQLIIPFKRDLFSQRVMEIYMELLEFYELPSAEQIEDCINEENTFIILNVFSQYGYNTVDIDPVLSVYYASCTYMLSSAILEVLFNKGVPYINTGISEPNLEITEENKKIRKEILDKQHFPQTIMFYEFLY